MLCSLDLQLSESVNQLDVVQTVYKLCKYSDVQLTTQKYNAVAGVDAEQKVNIIGMIKVDFMA